jgi:hypothetical protein
MRGIRNQGLGFGGGTGNFENKALGPAGAEKSRITKKKPRL